MKKFKLNFKLINRKMIANIFFMFDPLKKRKFTFSGVQEEYKFVYI